MRTTESPFVIFWRRLNEGAAAVGRPSIPFGQAWELWVKAQKLRVMA